MSKDIDLDIQLAVFDAIWYHPAIADFKLSMRFLLLLLEIFR